MRILWAAIQEAGALGWVMVVLGEVGVVAAFVAVLLPSWRRRMAVVATVFGAAAAIAGGAGVVRGRAATDQAIAVERDALRPVERLRARREGYVNARRLAEIGLCCGALPLLLGVVAAFAATRRRPAFDAADPEVDLSRFLRPRRGLAIGTAFAAVTASGFAAAARLEPVPGYDPIAEHATREIQERVADVEHAADRDCLLDTCVKLETALGEYGTSFDRAGAPGLPKVAHRCVEEAVQRAVLRSPISSVRDALVGMSGSAFVKQDPALDLLVTTARVEVESIAQRPRPAIPEDTWSYESYRATAGSATVGGAFVSGGDVANAAAVVAGMTAGFRRCYNKGLQEDPNMHGSMRVAAKLGPNGEVLSVSPAGSGLNGTVMSCVAARVSSAQFAPPAGGSATVLIPVTFVSR